MASGNNLLSSVKSLITPEFLNRAGQIAGVDFEKAQSGFSSALPILLSGLTNTGSTSEGARHLLNLIQEDGYEGGVPENYLEYLQGGKVTDIFLKKGMDALKGIFGENLNSIVPNLASTVGVSHEAIIKICSMLAPFVMGTLGAKMKGLGLDASSLMNFLKGQKQEGEIPERRFNRVEQYVPPEYSYQPPPSRRHNFLPLGIAALILASGLLLMRDRHRAREEAGIANRPQVAERAPSQSVMVVDQISEYLNRGSSSELPKRFVLENMEFDAGTMQPSRVAINTLDQIATALANHPKAKIQIEGFTDNVGSQESNLQLSSDRADAAKKYLVDRGANGNQISTLGRGSENPVASNDTEEGRSQNRRIELVVLSR